MKKPFEETFSKWRYLQRHPAFRRAPTVTLARLARWRVQCALGVPATVHLDPWKVRLFLPPQWRGKGTTGVFALRHLYERELAYLERFVSPGMVFVDAGANCGIYTVAAARLVGPSGRVLSFEPGSQAFSVLKRNVELNQFHNVRAYRAALCDKNGKARLYHSEQGQTSFSLGCPKNARVDFEEVTTRTLESVLEEDGADQVGLIKLDVEGAEELVLRGVEKIIVHSHPTIILEMNAFATEGMNLRRTGSWELLKSCGYDFFSLSDNGTLEKLDRPPAAYDITNVIAIHGKQ
jgi:FkbM family methyltransferase